MMVPPVPIFLLLCFVAFLKIPMLSVRFRFPPLVVNHLAVPRVAIVIVGIVVAGMNSATGAEHRS